MKIEPLLMLIWGMVVGQQTELSRIMLLRTELLMYLYIAVIYGQAELKLMISL
ncbi:hypothetical protein CEB3_c05220 [Peptococcaceae bacterium CEB3]|nr:hypothetical protein CEB3_c05220 [Peptococcaceae bacterium CEB3]